MLSNFNSSIENAWKSQNLTQVKGVTYDIKGISFSTKRKKKGHVLLQHLSSTVSYTQ